MSDNSSTADNNTSNNSGFLLESPFGRLSEVLAPNSLNNIFGSSDPDNNATDGGTSPTNNDLPYSGNPFAGDNFWNIFAGGINPASGDFSTPISSGGNFGSATSTQSQPMTNSNGAIAVSFSDEFNPLLNAPQANTEITASIGL